MSRRRSTQRSSTRKRRIKAPRKLSYDKNHRLHAFEEDLVVRILCVTPGSSHSLDMEYPHRFNARLLDKTLLRLNRKHRVVESGITMHKARTGHRMYHSRRYVPVYGPVYARTYTAPEEARSKRSAQAGLLEAKSLERARHG